MSEQSTKYKFPGDIDRDHLTTEQPIDPMINRKLQMPNPLDPMGNIAMVGRAMRNLSSGRMPMWVLMSAWATIGLISFLLLGMAINNLIEAFRVGKGIDRLGEFLLAMGAFAPIILITLLLITILFRATWRKRG